jgi:hypothetical protein
MRICGENFQFQSVNYCWELVSPVAKPGVSKWGGGLRGTVRTGCTPPGGGSGGCAPGKIFKLQMHVGEF